MTRRRVKSGERMHKEEKGKERGGRVPAASTRSATDNSWNCRLMNSHSNEVAARLLQILGIATKFPLGCCDYTNIYCVVVMF